MKICFDPHETPFAVGNVNYLGVQRPTEYRVSFIEGRNQHSFLHTASGSMGYTFMEKGMEDIIAPAGNLVFIPAGTKHSSTYMAFENSVDIIQFDLIAGELPDYLSSPFSMKDESINRLFCSICSDLRSGFGNNSMYFLYRIYELFWNISKNYEKIPNKFRKLQQALQELHLYYYDNCKIQYYADLCGMSEPGFRRLFREYTNLSPIEYRNQIRLQEARKLLKSGEFTIGEVALSVGFASLPFFCRSYKQQFGHSPGNDT